MNNYTRTEFVRVEEDESGEYTIVLETYGMLMNSSHPLNYAPENESFTTTYNIELPSPHIVRVGDEVYCPVTIQQEGLTPTEDRIYVGKVAEIEHGEDVYSGPYIAAVLHKTYTDVPEIWPYSFVIVSNIKFVK